MGLFVGDSQPSKIFVGDTQISKVFLGDTQVRPNEITETHRASEGNISVYKPGYKIKEITIQWTAYTTATGRSVTPSRGLTKSSNSLDLRSMFRCASQWHYSGYVDRGNGMLGGWRNNAGTGASDTILCAYLSSSTTKNGGSVLATINEDGGTLKSGTTFGTWVQDTTFTTSSNWKTRINSIFTASDVEIILSAGNTTVSNDLMTIVYEKA